MWDQKENYAHNGFTMAFILNVPMATVFAPEGYSPEAIAAIEPPAQLIPAAFDSSKPDVIMVMSRSFWDPTRLPGVAFSADPIPTVRAEQSGHVFSPEFGGMTANVEFEALTGFSKAFLPSGSIPYQQYIRRPLPSLASFSRIRVTPRGPSIPIANGSGTVVPSMKAWASTGSCQRKTCRRWKSAVRWRPTLP